MSRVSGRCGGIRTYHAAMVVMLVGSLVYPVAEAQVPNGLDVDGNHGVLHVRGLLTEGACRLDMASAWQDVDMGSLTTSTLPAPGTEGEPVLVTLHLKDCIRTRGDSLDRWTGTNVWDTVQPVVTVTFVAPVDPDSPSLLKVAGTQGIALRVTDAAHRTVRPGERGAPLFVTPSSDQLIYTITPVRTAAELVPGEYHAVLNFGLSYD